jgi:hypothetical protein
MVYLGLALRGFLIVGLVSWQTLNLQRGDRWRIALGAFLIGVVWYGNVLAAITLEPYGSVAYALGSVAGALAGWRLDKWL